MNLFLKKVIDCPCEEKLLSVGPGSSQCLEGRGEEQESKNASLTECDSIDNNDDDNDLQTCLICLESFKEGEAVSWSKTSTTCNHVYHEDCIIPWLINYDDCPCCRSMLI